MPARLWRGIVVFLTIAASGIFFLWWEIAHRGVYAYATSIYPIDDADEWRYTACSRLVLHGYRLFDQVYSAQPPLLFLSIAGAMRVTSQTITGARAAEIGFGALGLAASIWLAWQLGGRWAGVAAGVILAVSPGFLVYAHTVEAEGPMMALSALALALGVAAFRRDNLTLSVLGGVALAGAILFKLFAVEAALPMAWAVAGEWPLRRRTWSRLSYVAAGVIIPLAVDFGLVSPLQQWRQVFELHQKIASIPLPNLIPPGRILWDYLTLDPGLSLLALGGMILLVLTLRVYADGLLILWLPGSMLMLLAFRPLFPHHAAILSAPLAVTAGLGFGAALTQVPRRKLLALPIIAAAVVYLLFLPGLAHDDRHVLISVPAPSSALVAWLGSHSASNAFVATDDVRSADLANRLVPPPLCDPSTVRVRAGDLTDGDLIAATRTYRPEVVLPTAVFTEFRGYLNWLAKNYRKVRAPEGFAAYLRRPAQR